MGRRVMFDTNTLIDYEHNAFDATLFDADDIAIAAITVAEYQVGIELASTPSLAQRRKTRFRTILNMVEILEYTESTAMFHARLLAHTRAAGTPRGAHDLVIAAHAAQSGRVLVSRDAKARFTDLPDVVAEDI